METIYRNYLQILKCFTEIQTLVDSKLNVCTTSVTKGEVAGLKLV